MRWERVIKVNVTQVLPKIPKEEVTGEGQQEGRSRKETRHKNTKLREKHQEESHKAKSQSTPE